LFIFIYLSFCIYADDTSQLSTTKGEITENFEGSKQIFFWGNLGMGFSNYIFSLVLSASLEVDRHLLSIRALSAFEFLSAQQPDVYAKEYGILYGRVLRGKFSFASIAAGISYVSGVKRGKFLYREWITDYYEEVDFQTIGVPIEIQLFFTVYLIGAGVYGFANLNNRASFIGFALCLQLGKLSSPLLPKG
jgi:hypothetical protein